MSIVLNGTTGITAPDIDVTAQTTVAAFDAGITLGGSATTLDDYEEGTWTPTFVSSTYATGITITTATYTKIGDTILIEAIIVATGTTGNFAAGDYLRISGLPFTPEVGGGHYAGTLSASQSFSGGSRSSGVSLIVSTELYLGVDVALGSSARSMTMKVTTTYKTA